MSECWWDEREQGETNHNLQSDEAEKSSTVAVGRRYQDTDNRGGSEGMKERSATRPPVITVHTCVSILVPTCYTFPYLSCTALQSLAPMGRLDLDP